MSGIVTISPSQQGISGSMAITAGATKYYKLNDPTVAGVATEDFTVDITALVPTVISELFARTDVAPGTGKNIVITLYVNGVASVLTCTISGASAVSASDVSHTVKLQSGDHYCLQIAPDSGSSSTKVQAGAIVSV